MNEQPPSKELAEAIATANRQLDEPFADPDDDIRTVARQFLRSRETVERLQTALRGVASCSTCEACRGAATLALGGATPGCVHPWEKVGISAEGKPFCAECCVNLVKDPPWSSPEPPADRRFKIGDEVPVTHWGETSKIVSIHCKLANGETIDLAADCIALPPVDVRGVDCPACGKPMSEHKGDLKPGAVLWCP